jgi:uncharacterized protein YkwD
MPKKTQKSKYSQKKAIFVYGIFAAMLFLVTPARSAFASNITADTVIKLSNAARAQAGEALLQPNDELTKAAQAKAQDMINNDYFAHVSPQGKSPWFWIDQSGYDYRYAGENLAINFTDPQDQQQAWMNSPTHRENILNQKYQDTGVAVAEGMINGHDSIVSVQLFGTTMNAVAIVPVSQDMGTVAGAENAKPVLSPIGNNFDKAGAIEGNFKFTTWRAQFGNSLGWWAMALAAIALISVDAVMLVHRKHIKPILVAQAMQSRRA